MEIIPITTLVDASTVPPEVRAFEHAKYRVLGAGNMLATVVELAHPDDAGVIAALRIHTEARTAYDAAYEELRAMNHATEASVAAVRAEQGLDL